MATRVTKYPIKTVKLKEKGRSTLEGRKLWFDETFGRLNTEEKGKFLGNFEGDDKILLIYYDGNYEIVDQELTQRFDTANINLIEKFDPEKIVTSVYLDKEKLQYNIKRFKIETTSLHSKFFFIKEGEGNKLELATTIDEPLLVVSSGRNAQIKKVKYKVYKHVPVTGWKAVGTKLEDYKKNMKMEWEISSGTATQKELFTES